jgi:hypothetical protein
MNIAAYLLSLMFLARELTHREHLKTKSYAAHVALQGFYEGIIPLADSFAEVYQGMYGIIDNIPLANNQQGPNIESILVTQSAWIETTRTKFNTHKDKPLQNIIDEILALYYQTLYKLKYLS